MGPALPLASRPLLCSFAPLHGSIDLVPRKLTGQRCASIQAHQAQVQACSQGLLRASASTCTIADWGRRWRVQRHSLPMWSPSGIAGGQRRQRWRERGADGLNDHLGARVCPNGACLLQPFQIQCHFVRLQKASSTVCTCEWTCEAGGERDLTRDELPGKWFGERDQHPSWPIQAHWQENVNMAGWG